MRQRVQQWPRARDNKTIGRSRLSQDQLGPDEKLVLVGNPAGPCYRAVQGCPLRLGIATAPELFSPEHGEPLGQWVRPVSQANHGHSRCTCRFPSLDEVALVAWLPSWLMRKTLPFRQRGPDLRPAVLRQRSARPERKTILGCSWVCSALSWGREASISRPRRCSITGCANFINSPQRLGGRP